MNLNAIVIADDAAENIGELCELMKNSTNQLLEQFGQANDDIQINNTTYCTDSINKLNLSEKVSLVNSRNFLCCWFCHGTDTSFIVNGEEIVNIADNHYVFSNALIYTFSCMNGGTLADVLVKNGVKTFVGYTDKANCPYGLDDIICNIVMSFITALLRGESIKNAVDTLKSSYNGAIYNDELEVFQRSWFRENRDGITLKGDGTLTINDFLVA